MESDLIVLTSVFRVIDKTLPHEEYRNLVNSVEHTTNARLMFNGPLRASAKRKRDHGIPMSDAELQEYEKQRLDSQHGGTCSLVYPACFVSSCLATVTSIGCVNIMC